MGENVLLFLAAFAMFLFKFSVMAKPMELKSSRTIPNTTTENFSVVFPEEEMRFVFDKAPPCAEGATFCEEFNDYPEEHLKNVLQQQNINKDIFGVDVVPEFDARDDDDKFVCKSKLVTIFPKIAKNTKNNWKIIINQGKDDGYVQGVVVEKCLSRHKKCDIIGDNIRNNYVATCKQKYIYRRLLSLNDAGQPVPDSFLLPSACCCSYKKNFKFFHRG